MSTKGLRFAACWLVASLFASPVRAGAGEARVAGYHVLDPSAADLTHPEELQRTLGLQGTTQLPAEALAFYLSGLDAARAGDAKTADAELTWAAALDASFPEPRLALARLHFPGRPAAAGTHLWGAALASVASFDAQHMLAVNVLLGAALMAFLGGALVLAYVALAALPKGHHTVTELLRRWIPARIAPWLAALLMAAPLGWRVGLLPLGCLLAGLLLPWSRPAERRWLTAWTALIILAPIALWSLSPLLLSPFDPAGRPFLLQRAMASPHSPGLEAALAGAVEERAEDGDLWFALGLAQSRGTRDQAAWASYQKALTLGGPEWQCRNNLGVLAFTAGRVDEAMKLLEEASRLAPQAAAPHFNLSQVYARKLYFEKADQALAEANRLEFGRIRTALRNQKAGDTQALISETLPDIALWRAAFDSPRVMPGVRRGSPSWFRGPRGSWDP